MNWMLLLGIFSFGLVGGIIGYFVRQVVNFLAFWWKLEPVVEERLTSACPPRVEAPPHPAQVARLEMARWRAQKARRAELLQQEWNA